MAHWRSRAILRFRLNNTHLFETIVYPSVRLAHQAAAEFKRVGVECYVEEGKTDG